MSYEISPADQSSVGLMMLQMDPPRHTEFRKLINKGFTPRQVARLNDHIADMARQIVDDVIERGECDFVDEVAGALPSYVIAEMLGIPLEDGRRLYELSEILNSSYVVGDSTIEQAVTQMFYPSANRDESRFADPDRFDIGRAPNPHLAFGGGGTHFCLGANLARVEASAIIPEVLSRMNDLELAGPVERTRSNLINGIHSMPVRFTPARRLAVRRWRPASSGTRQRTPQRQPCLERHGFGHDEFFRPPQSS